VFARPSRLIAPPTSWGNGAKRSKPTDHAPRAGHGSAHKGPYWSRRLLAGSGARIVGDRQLQTAGLAGTSRVEPAGIEPATSCLQSSTANSAADAEDPEELGDSRESACGADYQDLRGVDGVKATAPKPARLVSAGLGSSRVCLWRQRQDSLPALMMRARRVRQSTTAFASRGSGNTLVQSPNGRLVPAHAGRACR
jgi:hypothetical protein